MTECRRFARRHNGCVEYNCRLLEVNQSPTGIFAVLRRHIRLLRWRRLCRSLARYRMPDAGCRRAGGVSPSVNPRWAPVHGSVLSRPNLQSSSDCWSSLAAIVGQRPRRGPRVNVQQFPCMTRPAALVGRSTLLSNPQRFNALRLSRLSPPPVAKPASASNCWTPFRRVQKLAGPRRAKRLASEAANEPVFLSLRIPRTSNKKARRRSSSLQRRALQKPVLAAIAATFRLFSMPAILYIFILTVTPFVKPCYGSPGCLGLAHRSPALENRSFTSSDLPDELRDDRLRLIV